MESRTREYCKRNIYQPFFSPVQSYLQRLPLASIERRVLRKRESRDTEMLLPGRNNRSMEDQNQEVYLPESFVKINISGPSD